MPAHHHPVRVTAIGMDMAQHPGQAGTALAHDFIDADLRAQGVVHDHRAKAQSLRTEGEAAELLGGIGPPVATMQKDQYRRGSAARCGEDIQRLGPGRAKRHVKHTSKLRACLGAALGKMLARRCRIGHRPQRVVGRINLRLRFKITVQLEWQGRGHGLLSRHPAPRP